MKGIVFGEIQLCNTDDLRPVLCSGICLSQNKSLVPIPELMVHPLQTSKGPFQPQVSYDSITRSPRRCRGARSCQSSAGCRSRAALRHQQTSGVWDIAAGLSYHKPWHYGRACAGTSTAADP